MAGLSDYIQSAPVFQPGLLTPSEEDTSAATPKEVAQQTSDVGVSRLESRERKVQVLRDVSKEQTFEPPKEQDRGLLQQLSDAEAPPSEKQAAHTLLDRQITPYKGLSRYIADEPAGDPAFNVIQSPNDGITISDTVNFLVGGEMGVVGMKYDNNGFSWDWENAKKQWAEEPLWVNLLSSASLVGTIAFPALKALQASTKFGRVGTMLGRFGERADEVTKFKALGAIDASIPETEITEHTLRQLRRLDYAKSKHLDFETKKLAEQEGTMDQLGMSVVDKMKWQFDKRFANTYFEQLASISKTGQVKQEYLQNLDKLWKNERVGKFFVNMPDPARGMAVYANMLAKSQRGAFDTVALIKRANPGLADVEAAKLAKSFKLSPEEQLWSDSMYDAMKSHQDEALREGLVTPEMRQRLGEIHLPAFNLGTPADAASTRTIAIPLAGKISKDTGERSFKAFQMPRLDAPQIRYRSAEVGDVADRLFKGQLITSPGDLTFQGYVTDRLLLNNFRYIRDHAIQYGRSSDDILKAFGSTATAEKNGWVSLSKLDNGVPEVSAALRRMLKQSGYALGEGDALPYLHKSHYEAMFGNGGLFEQTQNVGNLLSLLTAIHKTAKTVFNIPTHLNNFFGNMAFLSMSGYNPANPKNLNTMADVTKAFMKWADAHDGLAAAGKSVDTLYNPVTKALKGVNLGKATVNGKVFDLNQEFLNPMVKDIIGEESAFLHAEGLSIMHNFLRRAREGSLERGIASSMLKVKDMTKIGSKTMDGMTRAYLGEDVVPKMAYFLDLRSRGISPEWAALEVGRRLPVYSTVGSSIQRSRRVFLPWATFPAEATRILKNNMVDNPIAMLPWLHLPGIMQAGFAATGLGPTTYDESQQRMRQLPLWAQNSATVLTNQAGSNIGATATAGIAGAAVGAGLLGAPGAAIGAALGGATGYLATQLQDEKETGEKIRGSVLRWLPWSAITPKSNSPEYVWDIPGTMAQLPAEPLAIIQPAVNVMAGKDAYGQDIKSSGTLDQMGKMFAGTMGMLMPPFFQKYGFRTTTPDAPITQALLGKKVPGDITNMSRFITDTGQAVDPVTGEPGNFTFDFLMNNVNGLWQSYAVRPEVRLMNEARQEAALSEIRGYYGKQIEYYSQNSDWPAATEMMNQVFSTFSRQYTADPAQAQSKFSEWMQRYIKSFGRHPALRNMTEDELHSRFKLASDSAMVSRSEARKDIMRVLDRENRTRKLQ